MSSIFRRFNKIVESNIEPSNTNDIWLNKGRFCIYYKGEWSPITITVKDANTVVEYVENNIEFIINEIEKRTTNKQDTIEDLETIREGAAKGATAIQSVKTINGQSIEGEGNITIEGGGSNITVDSELSATSENPVQNKVIYENLYGMNQQYIQMYEEQNQVFINAISNVHTELLNKVDQSYVNNAIANAITTTLNTAV